MLQKFLKAALVRNLYCFQELRFGILSVYQGMYYLTFGKNCLPFSLQLLWEAHTGFPTMEIATSLPTHTPQGDSTEKSLE